VQNYLFAGDCYQINLAMAFNSRFHGSTYAGWHQLVSRHPAPHACYLSSSTGHVMSASPERFLSIENGNILTSPIKGSQPRGKTPEEDARLGRLLSNSKKDRAENLMIVDLLRNDLGAICETGSVVAEPLFELERFSNVQHLVSHIRGKLLPDMTPVEALISCFPGGSITGAPKRRAMEIIHELEPAARGAYCGSFFTLDDNGKLDANILIRTFQTQNDRLQIHGGSGITAASTCDNEYDECLFKVEKLMEALSQIPALPKES
jgi:para-aminobenzoate synthetase component 1